jgi:hypothetical protein
MDVGRLNTERLLSCRANSSAVVIGGGKFQGLGDRGKWVVSLFMRTQKLRKATISLTMSVRLSARNNSAPIDRIFMKFGIWDFSESLPRNFRFHWNVARITGTSHEDPCRNMIMSRWILLGMRKPSDKSRRENQIARFISWCTLFISNLTIILFRDGINQILVGISSSPIAVLVQFNGKSIFFRKSCSLWDNAVEYGTAREARDDHTKILTKYVICVPSN